MLETIILKPVRGMMNGLKNSKISAFPMRMTVKGYGELADFQTEYNQLIDMIVKEEGVVETSLGCLKLGANKPRLAGSHVSSAPVLDTDKR